MHSVGLLYSAQEFISFVDSNIILGQEFDVLNKRFGVSNPSNIYSIAMRCNWVKLDDNGICILTFRGREISKESSERIKLRYQLQDIISVYQPTWSIKLRDGRKEAQQAFPPEVDQIFKEAGLFDTWSDEIIVWWDELAQLVRMRKASELLKTGRRAEKLSFKYEEKRTGTAPHWRSLDSNFSGYDILSIYGADNPKKIKIEVKGSELRMTDSSFYITSNEWLTAKRSEVYRFHLWIFKGTIRLIELDSSEVSPHIPNDTGEGKWQNVRIPMKAFKDKAIVFTDAT